MYLVGMLVLLLVQIMYTVKTNSRTNRQLLFLYHKLRRNVCNISPETFHSRDVGRRPVD